MNVITRGLLRHVIVFAGLLLLLMARPAVGDIFYKEIQLGPYCTFEISRFWDEEKIGWKVPASVREITVDFKAGRYAGKEVVLDASYIKSTHKASVEGAAENGIRQASSQPGVSGFRYECLDFFMIGSKAKTCTISYKKNHLSMNYQALYIVPDNDPNSAYSFMSGYQNTYSKKVVDRIFGSIRIQH